MPEHPVADPLKNPEIQLILRSYQIAGIAAEIAHKLHMPPIEALKRFYESDTCRRLHDRSTLLYIFSDGYVADDFVQEYRAKQ